MCIRGFQPVGWIQIPCSYPQVYLFESLWKVLAAYYSLGAPRRLSPRFRMQYQAAHNAAVRSLSKRGTGTDRSPHLSSEKDAMTHSSRLLLLRSWAEAALCSQAQSSLVREMSLAPQRGGVFFVHEVGPVPVAESEQTNLIQ